MACTGSEERGGLPPKVAGLKRRPRCARTAIVASSARPCEYPRQMEEGDITMSTTTEQNKAVIRRFLDAWNNRQLEAFDELIAPDVVRHCQATPGADVRSLDQLKEFLRQDTAVFPDSIQTITHLVAEGDFVAAWSTYEGTQKGPMG